MTWSGDKSVGGPNGDAKSPAIDSRAKVCNSNAFDAAVLDERCVVKSNA